MKPLNPLKVLHEPSCASMNWMLLGMDATTFDYARAQANDHAVGHEWSVRERGETVPIAAMGLDRATPPIRPTGGAWTSANDAIRYVQLELSRGLV